MVDVVWHETPVPPTTVEEAVALLMSRLSDEEKAFIRSLPEDQLMLRLQFTLGMEIRNDFGLLGGNTVLLQACGSEKMSANDASSVIIRAFWRRLHG